MELAILAAEVKQVVAARFEDRLQDAPDEDEMIPARMHRLARALKAAQRAVQDRRAEFPDLPGGRGKTVLSPSGKAVRCRLLPDLDDIDGKSLRFPQAGPGPGPLPLAARPPRGGAADPNKHVSRR